MDKVINELNSELGPLPRSLSSSLSMSRQRTEIAKGGLKEYATLVAELKERIRSAQVRAGRSVNRELIKLYWDIGRAIVERQKRLGWGKTVVEKLAHDLRVEFPDQKGFSSRNLWEMRLFFETYAVRPKLQQLVAELPWGQNLRHSPCRNG